MRSLLKEYTLVRAKVYQGQETISAENTLIHDSDNLQKQIWQLALSDCKKVRY